MITGEYIKEVKEYVETYLNKLERGQPLKLRFSFWDFVEILEGIVKMKKMSHFSAPTEVQWESTARCNHRCYFCYFSHNLNSNVGELTTKEVIKVIDELNDMGVLILTIEGGEPFVRKDMLDVLRYIKKNTDICVDILTNGSLISKSMVYTLSKLLDSRCDAMQISLLADNKEIHYKTTRAMTWDNIIQNTKNLINNGLSVRTNTVITKYNYNRLDKIYLLAAEIGINSGFSVVPPFQYDDALYSNQSMFFEVVKSLNRAFKYEKAHPTTQIVGLPPFYYIPHVRDVVGDSIKNIYGYVNRTGCVAFSTKLNINYNGDVYPCVFLQYPEFKMGNVKSENIKDIWNKDNKIVNIFRNKRMNAPHKCGQCELSRICSGGCYGATYYKYRRFDLPDPRCRWRRDFE